MEKDTRRDSFSEITGTILLIYVIASYTDRVLLKLPITLGSFSVLWTLRLMDIVSVLISLILALRFYLILRENFEIGVRSKMNHVFLPFVTVLSVTLALRNTTGGMTWWLLLFLAGLLIYGVMFSEYTICDINSPNRPIALILLSALCYAVFLLAMMAIRTNVTRLVFEMPLCFMITVIDAIRLFSLWMDTKDVISEIFSCGIIMMFSMSGLHYWPINTVSCGVLMFIWYYLISNTEILLSQGRDIRFVLKLQIPVGIILIAAFIYTTFWMI